MRGIRSSLPTFVLLIAGLAACGGAADGGGEEEMTPEERAAARQAARIDSVARAEAQYDPSAFDTIQWPSEQAMWERGGVVWSFSCQKCHGTDGTGSGELAVQHELEMPDLTAPGWEHAGDIEAIRHQVYVGHESEMPSWGLYGLKYRDVDAVAHYIDDLLRSRSGQ